jgi:hypothetical protein
MNGSAPPGPEWSLGFYRRGGWGKCVENRKKILNSGNELKNMLKPKALALSGAKNELVFECKRTPIEAKKWSKTHLFAALRRDEEAIHEGL